MITEYLPSFLKDIKALKSTPEFTSIKALVFEEIRDIPDFEDIRNLKKLKGFEDYYRISAFSKVRFLLPSPSQQSPSILNLCSEVLLL